MKNWIGVAIKICFVLTVFVWNQDFAISQEDGDNVVIGRYRTLHSDILGEDRLLLIHLPEEYEETRLSYPVLYLLYGNDINNYFGEAVIISEKLGSTGEIPPMIVVGVANTDRYRDNLPAKIQGRSDSGGADNFLNFFAEELIPYIEKNYRSKKFRILAGPQAGAVFGLYALITEPGVFNAVISENPFMNPENAAFLYPKAESFFKKTESLRSSLYIECEKDDRPQDLEFVRNFTLLLESHTPEGFRYKVKVEDPSGYFIPPLPFREGLRMIYTGHKLPANFQTNTVKDIIDYYEKLSQEYGFTVDPPSHSMMFEGVKLNQQGKTKEAIQLFQYQLSLYPKSLNALWQLGEIYRGTGEFETAREYYRKFLELRDTDVAMIRTRLNQVEKIINESAAYQIEQEIDKNGLEAGLRKFREIRNGPESQLYFEESEFFALGYRLMGKGKRREAIEVFKLNVSLYPDSGNVYDSLGEAYMKNGDNENAMKSYKKSLELDPENKNAQEMLKKLEKK